VEPTRNERFEGLFRDNYAAVRGYALRRAPRDMAQDVVAETFLVAWRRLDDVPADALPWLYGVARRVLANQRRSADRGVGPRAAPCDRRRIRRPGRSGGERR
jgi:RNA polymerase sigma-70 factor (ECF subfamily)